MPRRREATEVDVRGNRLRCPVCGETRFFRRAATVASWWSWPPVAEWFARRATTFTCAACGHILWFRPRR